MKCSRKLFIWFTCVLCCTIKTHLKDESSLTCFVLLCHPSLKEHWMCSLLYFDKIYISLCCCESHPKIIFMYFVLVFVLFFVLDSTLFCGFMYKLLLFISSHMRHTICKCEHYQAISFLMQVVWSQAALKQSKAGYSSQFYQNWWRILFDTNKEFMSTKKKHWASHKMKVQTKINREEDMSKYKKLCRTASICMLYELFQFCLVFRFNFFLVGWANVCITFLPLVPNY